MTENTIIAEQMKWEGIYIITVLGCKTESQLQYVQNIMIVIYWVQNPLDGFIAEVEGQESSSHFIGISGGDILHLSVFIRTPHASHSHKRTKYYWPQV